LEGKWKKTGQTEIILGATPGGKGGREKKEDRGQKRDRRGGRREEDIKVGWFKRSGSSWSGGSRFTRAG
jgi:hypothetical protein